MRNALAAAKYHHPAPHSQPAVCAWSRAEAPPPPQRPDSAQPVYMELTGATLLTCSALLPALLAPTLPMPAQAAYATPLRPLMPRHPSLPTSSAAAASSGQPQLTPTSFLEDKQQPFKQVMSNITGQPVEWIEVSAKWGQQTTVLVLSQVCVDCLARHNVGAFFSSQPPAHLHCLPALRFAAHGWVALCSGLDACSAHVRHA